MKKTFLALSMIIVSLMVMGCVKTQTLPLNSFYFEMKTTVNGEIAQSLAFPTFSEELKSKYSENKVKEYEQALCTEIYNKVFSNFYLKYWMRYIEQTENNTMGMDEISFVRPYLDENRIIFSIQYNNVNAWRIYNGGEEQEKEEGGIEFIKEIESSSSFPFSQKNSEGESVANIYKSILNNIIKQVFPMEDISHFEYSFEYRYITPYEKINSNADVVKNSSEGVIHSWEMNSEIVNQDREIKNWAIEANTGWWYLFFLIGIKNL